MTVTWKFTEIRPSTDIDFVDYDDEAKEHMLTYSQYCPILSLLPLDEGFWTVSPDKLTRTVDVVWNDAEQAENFLMDIKIVTSSIVKEQLSYDRGIIRKQELL